MKTFSTLFLLVVSSLASTTTSPNAVENVRCSHTKKAHFNCRVSSLNFALCNRTLCELRLTSMNWLSMPNDSFTFTARAVNATNDKSYNSSVSCTLIFGKPQSSVGNAIEGASLICKKDRLSDNDDGTSTNNYTGATNISDVTPALFKNQSSTPSRTRSIVSKMLSSQTNIPDGIESRAKPTTVLLTLSEERRNKRALVDKSSNSRSSWIPWAVLFIFI